MTSRVRGNGGFTLLEVIVAMALFAAGIVAISRLFTGALQLCAGARDASAGAIYARQRMEEALLAPVPAEGMEQGDFGDGYRWKLETSFIPPEEEKPYDEIRMHVTVRWHDGGDERVVDLSATRWRWKETGEGDLATGSGRKPTGSEAGSGENSGGEGESSGTPTLRRLR